ncbi:m7GpppX diphosphatase isoform X2 [Hyalella azteca]|uniref:m7GpppX diphosphatase n=1 Tax=Hyalella azteca TaxID=294128 RepID=A0A8B7PPS0_HYAAZ|nr:m7GpppX diphosphatase isoform X2 [Hyalella azteca]
MSSQNSVPFTDISEFKIVKILRHDRFCVDLLVRHDALPAMATIRLQKTRFDVDERRLQEVIASCRCLKEQLRNDVFSQHTAHLPPPLNKVEVSIKYPVAKYELEVFESHHMVIVKETAQLYESHSKGYICRKKASHKKWILNILEGNCEANRVILRDADPQLGFVLIKDIKWTDECADNLFCQAIVNRRDLASIRDLTGDCLPLLYNIRDQGTVAIEEKYGVKADQLRVYLHYLPSFYHLHVHFASLSFCHEGMEYGKVHVLDTVISNLEMDRQYYQKVTLNFVGYDSHPHPLLRRTTPHVDGGAFRPVYGKRKRPEDTPSRDAAAAGDCDSPVKLPRKRRRTRNLTAPRENLETRIGAPGPDGYNLGSCGNKAMYTKSRESIDEPVHYYHMLRREEETQGVITHQASDLVRLNEGELHKKIEEIVETRVEEQVQAALTKHLARLEEAAAAEAWVYEDKTSDLRSKLRKRSHERKEQPAVPVHFRLGQRE